MFQCGLLIEAATSIRSFRPKERPLPAATNDAPGYPSVESRSTRRSHAPHANTTDPEARQRKGRCRETKSMFADHALMGTLTDCRWNSRSAEPTDRRNRTRYQSFRTRFKPAGSSSGCGLPTGTMTRCVRNLRHRRVALHVTPHQLSAIDGRTTRHTNYRLSPGPASLRVGLQQYLRCMLVVELSRKAGRECRPDCDRHLAVAVTLTGSKPTPHAWRGRASEFAQTSDPTPAAMDNEPTRFLRAMPLD